MSSGIGGWLEAAFACALGAIFIAVTSRAITNGVKTTLMYLLMAALAFGVAGIVAKIVASQRE